jgi:hypothetical protein
VPDIHDLQGAGKVLVGEVPDPLRAIAEHYLLPGSVPSALPSFCVEVGTKEFSGFDRPDVRWQLDPEWADLLNRWWFG